ncbi:MAG TPA: hypothetical protein VHT96_00135 [Clostridia bacterium]|nr:hypothetical protein [Clostridia bacterium]
MQSCQAEDNFNLFKRSFDLELRQIFHLASAQYGDGGFAYSYRLGGVDLFPLWFIHLTIQYIKETARYEILDENLPFIGRSYKMHISEENGSVLYEPGKSPLYYHLEYAYDKFCRQLSACSINIPENIIAAGLFSYIGKDFVKLCGFSDIYFGASLAAKKLRQLNAICSPVFSDIKQVTGVLDFLKHAECRCSKGLNSKKCYCEEIKGFVRSYMLGILILFSREYAGEYWFGTSKQWNLKETSEWILGIKPGFVGLYVDPCVPERFTSCEVNRYFRNALYKISLKSSSRAPLEIRKLTVDQVEYLGNVVPDFSDEKTHDVEVSIGSYFP